MPSFDDPIEEEVENFDEAPIAEDEVVSAARSCSAIIVIVVIVGTILCIMLAIALVYG
jgi:hypothetical protein